MVHNPENEFGLIFPNICCVNPKVHNSEIVMWFIIPELRNSKKENRVRYINIPKVLNFENEIDFGQYIPKLITPKNDAGSISFSELCTSEIMNPISFSEMTE